MYFYLESTIECAEKEFDSFLRHKKLLLEKYKTLIEPALSLATSHQDFVADPGSPSPSL